MAQRSEHTVVCAVEQVGTVEEHAVAPQHEYMPAGHAEQVPSRLAGQLVEQTAAVGVEHVRDPEPSLAVLAAQSLYTVNLSS